MGNLSSSACPILGSPGLMTNNLMLCVYFCNEIGLIFYSSFWSHWMLDWWGLHLAIGGDGYSHFILMGQPRPLFVYFCFFKHKFYRKTVSFSEICTWIVVVESEHAGHLTTTSDIYSQSLTWSPDQNSFILFQPNSHVKVKISQALDSGPDTHHRLHRDTRPSTSSLSKATWTTERSTITKQKVNKRCSEPWLIVTKGQAIDRRHMFTRT